MTTLARHELKKCPGCDRGLMAGGVPLVVRVTVELIAIDLNAVRQTGAMEDYFGGNAQLGAMFSPHNDFGKPVGPARRMVLCNDCRTEPTMIAKLEEQGEEVTA